MLPSPILPEQVSEIEEKLGYPFQVKEELKEALIDPYFYKDYTGKFQRLVFIGDKTLNNVVAKIICEMYPTSALRIELIKVNTCNEMFARMAVSSGLVDFFQYNNEAKLNHLIQVFREDLVTYPVFSNGLVNSPKPLADLIKAIFGAIAKDCNKNHDVIEKVFWKLKLSDQLVVPETYQENPWQKMREMCVEAGYKACVVDDNWLSRGEIIIMVSNTNVGRAMHEGDRHERNTVKGLKEVYVCRAAVKGIMYLDSVDKRGVEI